MLTKRSVLSVEIFSLAFVQYEIDLLLETPPMHYNHYDNDNQQQ